MVKISTVVIFLELVLGMSWNGECSFLTVPCVVVCFLAQPKFNLVSCSVILKSLWFLSHSKTMVFVGPLLSFSGEI